MKRKKTLLLTGAAGFIGSNVLEFLFEKYADYHFLVLDAITYAGRIENIPEKIRKSARFSFHLGEVQNQQLVDELVAKSDVIIHFAAETHVTRSIYDNLKFFETDVVGTHAVANAVLKHRATVDRFIHISTCEVYGEGVTGKMDEHHPLNPHSPYAAAKAGADRLVYSYYKTYGIPAVIVRPFNIYGPRQHLEKVTPRFITSGLLREPVTVHGTGTYNRDFMYVDDLSRALDILIHAPLVKIVGEVFNIGSGKPLAIIDLAKIVMRLVKCPPEQLVHVGDRLGQVGNFTCDYTKFNKAFGWKPKVSYKDGIERTVLWYKKNRKLWEDQIMMRHIPVTTVAGTVEMH